MSAIRRIWDSFFEANGRARRIRRLAFGLTLLVGSALYAIRWLAERALGDAPDVLHTLDAALRVIFIFLFVELGLLLIGWEIVRLSFSADTPSSGGSSRRRGKSRETRAS